LSPLEISFIEEEICDLFEACDIDEDKGMKFNEFIAFLCLVYLLNESAVSEAVSFINHINSHSNIMMYY
jgi:calcium-binding protein CML